MIQYNVYYVEGCDNRERYQKMIGIAIALCDTLSLIYFKYSYREKYSESVAAIKRTLKKYAIGSDRVSEWPLTEVRDVQNHIYNMVTYGIPRDFTFDLVFERINNLWDWDYPEHPMDPCFYRNGVVFFASSAHEQMNELYLRADGDSLSVNDFESVGLKLTYLRTVSEEEMFHLPIKGPVL